MIDGLVKECRIKGKAKKHIKKILTGDYVEVEKENDTYVIVSILDRINELNRPQVANITQVFLVASCTEPDSDFITLDKMLINILRNDLKVKLVFNKVDLVDEYKINQITEYYKNIPLEIYFISNYFNQGIGLLMSACRNEVTILAGQSGVGKTSLLNSLLGRNEPTSEISNKTKRGRHTTRHVELFTIEDSGFIVDTPGFSSLDLDSKIHSSKIKDFYLDFTPYSSECNFSNCTHLNEPNCAVKEFVNLGKISLERYQNYQFIYNEKKEKERR